MSATDFFAIDLGRSSIKVAQVRRKSETAADLLRLGSIAFPPSLETVIPPIDKSEKMELYVSVIKSLIESSGISVSKVVTAVPENQIITKLLNNIPIMDAAKLEETIHWESKNALPYPIEKAQMDWLVVQEKQTAEGRKVIDVMVIASPT